MTAIRGFSARAKWVIDYLAPAQRTVLGGFMSKYGAWIMRNWSSWLWNC